MFIVHMPPAFAIGTPSLDAVTIMIRLVWVCDLAKPATCKVGCARRVQFEGQCHPVFYGVELTPIEDHSRGLGLAIPFQQVRVARVLKIRGWPAFAWLSISNRVGDSLSARAKHNAEQGFELFRRVA